MIFSCKIEQSSLLKRLEMKMNVIKICTLASVLVFAPAYAGTVDGQASIDFWYVQGDVNHDIKGQKDQELNKKVTPQIQLAIEHDVPLVPNVMIRHADINQNASNSQINSDVNVGITDLVLSYDVLDHNVNTDLGVAIKRVDGQLNYNGGETDISKTIPMIYASVGAKLPITGVSANVQALATKYNNVQGVDVQAEVKYNVVEKLLYDVGAKIGYRMLDLRLDEKGKEQKLRFQGPFLGIQMGF